MYKVYVYVHVHVYDIWERTDMTFCNMSNSNHVNKYIEQVSRQHLLWLAIFMASYIFRFPRRIVTLSSSNGK